LDKGVPQWAEFNSLFRKLVLRLGFEKFAEATALEEIYRIYLRQVPETHRAMITGHALLGGKEPTLGMVMEYMKKVQGDTIQSVMAKIFVKPSIANTPIVPTTEPLTTSEGGDAMDLSVVQSRAVHSVSCFYCKKLGHVVRNCRLKTQDLDAEKRRKHYAENANAKRNVYEGQRRRNGNFKQRLNVTEVGTVAKKRVDSESSDDDSEEEQNQGKAEGC
jgi:hypothetical protein